MSNQGDDGEDQDLVIYHPNREKAASQATKAIVVLLLIVSGILTLLITAGGWTQLQGAKPFSIAFILVFFVMAYYVSKWQRGVLPLAAGLAVMLGVFAAIASFGAGNWADRTNTGYGSALLPAGLIWLFCVLLVLVLLLVIVFAMRGFSQKWNVEIEMTQEEYNRRRRSSNGNGYRYAQTG